MKELFLLRGLPGSGKSTLAKSLSGSHFEADMYFIQNGVYKFEPSKLELAHNWCMIQTEKAMADDVACIIVSNTFTQEWEIQRYYEMAKYYDYQVFSLIVENRHGGVNAHGVSEDKLKKMRDRFEVSL